MNGNTKQKCRGCLKESAKGFPLSKQAKGCNPKTTYSQVLKEYIKLEFPKDYEHLMPQYLCSLCCRELRNLYNFIRKVHHCNNKLLNAISKQFDCLQERTIDLPQTANKLEEKSIDIKIESVIDEDNIKNQRDELNIDEPCVHLKSKELEESLESDIPIENVRNEESILKHSIISDTSHKVTHNAETTSKCPICNKTMSRRDNLLTHMRRQHDIVEPGELLRQENKPKDIFACKLCPKKYTSNKNYLKHLEDKHNTYSKENENKIFQCLSCDYTARSMSTLNYHIRSKHGTEEERYKCKFCTKQYIQKRELLWHVKKWHKELIKTLKAQAENKEEQWEILLGKCENSLDNNYDSSSSSSFSDDNIPLAQRISKSQATTKLINQVEGQIEKELFSDEEFIRNLLGMKKRSRTSQGNKSLTRRCDECGKIYKNYSALYAHQRYVHVSKEEYSSCPYCSKKCKRKSNLQQHINNVHADKTSKDIVKKSTSSKNKEKRIMCTECPYICGTITTLTIHRNRHHTGEKPYKCEFCGKSFVVSYDLKLHRYLHTGERPVKCPICSKGFQDKAHLAKHKRMHVSLPPNQCDECGKRFTQRYNLLAHKRIHLRAKNLNCIVCDKVFENKSLLNLHRINENHHDLDKYE